MKEVYEVLLMIIDEVRMSRDGKYLSYFANLEELAEDFGLTTNSKAFATCIKNEFGIDVDSIKGDVITLDSSNSVGGNIYTEPKQFNDILHYMMSENDYKKYVDIDKMKEIRGY